MAHPDLFIDFHLGYCFILISSMDPIKVAINLAHYCYQYHCRCQCSFINLQTVHLIYQSYQYFLSPHIIATQSSSSISALLNQASSLNYFISFH